MVATTIQRRQLRILSFEIVKNCEVRETLEWINTIETLDVPALLNPAPCMECDMVERLTNVGSVVLWCFRVVREPPQLCLKRRGFAGVALSLQGYTASPT